MFLSLVLTFLCFQNYIPGTFLSGWDNLHPEFNFLSNIKRSIFSVWQEYQGLGLLAGMAHAADLPRQLILLFFSLFIPQSFLRYLWHFGMLFLGTFGVYYLSLYISRHHHNRIPAVLSALFYLLNFGSVQYFALPFEPYSTFWGFFPWLILVLFSYLDNPSKRTIARLLAVNFLAIPSFYVQTIFLVYVVCISLVIIINFLSRPHVSKLKVYGSIALSLFFLNSFWLLPNLYFTLTRVSVTQNAMMNLMVTDQFQEQNYHRGHLGDFALLQEPYYDLKDYTGQNVQPLFLAWHQHFNKSSTVVLGYLLFFFCLIGILLPHQYKKYFLAILGFASIGLLSATPPFSYLNHLLLEIPIFGQIFRNSFTKLIVPAILSLSLLSSIGFHFIHQFLSRFRLSRFIALPLSGFYLIILFSFSSPSFSGNYFHPNVKSPIPADYFQLFDYLRYQDPSLRIMDLPQYDFWGWYNYRWGQTGSGFLWYGIDQPILSRTFDVWSSEDENYFWQLRYALNTHNPIYFDKLLQKYQVNYVLFDASTFFPNAGNSNRQLRENQQLIDESSSLVLEKQFGHLNLYRVITSSQVTNQVTIFQNLPNLQLTEEFNHFDPAFIGHDHYQSQSSLPYTAQYPFGSLFSNRPESNQVSINESNDQISLSSPFASLASTASAQLSIYPLNNRQSAQFPLLWQDCLSSNPIIQAQNEEVVSFFNCGPLPTDQGYLLKISASNYFGRPLLYKIFTLDNNRIYLDSRLKESGSIDKYIFLPPITKFDNGIGINFSSLSYSNLPSRNLIHSVKITPLPYDQITAFTAQDNQPTPITSTSHAPAKVSHPNQSFYRIEGVGLSSNSTLALFQAYHPGWLAFYFDNNHLKFLNNHILVDNWANGWQLPADQSSKALSIYIFFWPQLLQFLGFGLLIFPIIRLFRR